LSLRRLGGRTGGILLAAASLFVGGLALEALSRLTQPVGAWNRADLSVYTEYDPRLGWRKRAGARARLAFPEYTYDVAINAQGLRDPERSYESSRGIARVLLLGDSFVEGIGVASEDGVARRLEAGLEARTPVEVVNGAAAATAPTRSCCSTGSRASAMRRAWCSCSSTTTTCSATRAMSIGAGASPSSR